MVTAAELLGTATDMIYIDVVSRTINIPKNLTLLGVTSDEDVQKLRFTMSRQYNGIDLSTHTIRINYENAQGEGDVYPAVEKKVTDDTIEFTWIVSRHATMYEGKVKFTVCAILTDADSNRISEFNTIPATLPVVEGLETDQAENLEDYPDIIDAVATETLAKAKANGDFTPVKGVDYYTPEEAEAFGQMVVDNANGQFANAIKGTKSGEIVRVDDVSPIEHTVNCWVHGKNLFDISKLITTTGGVSSAYVSEVGNDYVVITTLEGYTGNGYCTVPVKLKEACPGLVVGKSYVLNAVTQSDSSNIYFPGIQRSWVFGTTMVMTDELLDSTMTLYGFSATMGAGNCVLSHIQIEEGSIATAYEPYIDPTTVTVTACGKNILEVTGETTTQAGVTFTVNSNGSITVNGTATENTFYKVGKINLANCGQYYVSGSPTNSGVTTSLLYIHDVESYADVYDYGNGRAFTPTGGTCDVVIGVYKGYTANNLVYWPMVEAGTERTEFEKFTKKLTYNPATDGKCTVSSVSPTMTLFTDTPGVIVEAEYSRDTTKMFESYVLTDRAIGAIAAEIEDDMVEVLEALNTYAESLTGGDS